MYQKLWLVLVFSLLGTSLVAQKPLEIEITKKDLKLPKTKLSVVASRIEYVPLETKPECLIHLARGFRIKQAGDNWLVSSYMDGKAFVFGPDGKFITRIGTRGKGPGEYTQFYSVSYDPSIDKFLMLMTQNRLNIYQSDGTFDKQIKFDTSREIKRLFILEENWILYWMVPKENNLCELGLTYCDRAGNAIKDCLIDFGSEYATRCILWNYFPLYTLNNHIISGSFPAYDLFDLDPQFNWNKRLHITLPFKKLPPDLLSGYDKLNDYSTFRNTHGYLHGVKEFNDYLILKFFDPWMKKILVHRATGKLLNLSYDQNRKITEGFINDLDGGPPFNPEIETGDGRWVDIIAAFEFLEQSQNPIQGIDVNSNPVIMIIK